MVLQDAVVKESLDDGLAAHLHHQLYSLDNGDDDSVQQPACVGSGDTVAAAAVAATPAATSALASATRQRVRRVMSSLAVLRSEAQLLQQLFDHAAQRAPPSAAAGNALNITAATGDALLLMSGGGAAGSSSSSSRSNRARDGGGDLLPRRWSGLDTAASGSPAGAISVRDARTPSVHLADGGGSGGGSRDGGGVVIHPLDDTLPSLDEVDVPGEVRYLSNLVAGKNATILQLRAALRSVLDEARSNAQWVAAVHADYLDLAAQRAEADSARIEELEAVAAHYHLIHHCLMPLSAPSASAPPSLPGPTLEEVPASPGPLARSPSDFGWIGSGIPMPQFGSGSPIQLVSGAMGEGISGAAAAVPEVGGALLPGAGLQARKRARGSETEPPR